MPKPTRTVLEFEGERHELKPVHEQAREDHEASTQDNEAIAELVTQLHRYARESWSGICHAALRQGFWEAAHNLAHLQKLNAELLEALKEIEQSFAEISGKLYDLEAGLETGRLRQPKQWAKSIRYLLAHAGIENYRHAKARAAIAKAEGKDK